MGGLGFPELLVILVIVLVIFGGGKLPAIGDALGRSIRNFKKAASGEDETPPGPPADKKA
jgi:sec-independent protein translocase protein TatA